jgi:hypothetical protein
MAGVVVVKGGQRARVPDGDEVSRSDLRPSLKFAADAMSQHLGS